MQFNSLNEIFQSIGQVAGNESLDMTPAVEEVVVATVEEVAEAIIDKELADFEKTVTESCSIADKHENVIEALQDKVEDLEEQIDGMEAQLASGTAFNQGLFMHHMNRANRIATRFGAGIEVSGNESYKDVSEASLNSYAGLESLKDTAKKAAGKIKEIFVGLYQAIVATITGLFDRLSGLQKKADVLGQRVDAAAKANKISTDKVTLSASQANYVDAKGKTGNLIPALVAGMKAAAAALSAGSNHMVDGITKASNSVAGAGTKSSIGTGEGTEGIKSKVNGLTIVLTVPKTEEKLARFNISTAKDGKEESVSALSASELKAITAEAKKAAGELQVASVSSKSLMAARDKAIGAMESKQREGDNKTVATVRAGHQAALRLVRTATQIGGDAIAAQLSFVNAHLGAAAPKEETKED